MRRNTAVPSVCVFAFAVVAGVQGQEFARVLRNGEQATLSAFGPRPVDLAAEKLAEEFGIALNVEDPVYLYRNDIEQIGTARSGKPLFIPKSSLLEMRLDLREDGSLANEEQVVIDLRETASRLLPFEYRVDGFSHAYSLIPFRTRDEQGRFVQLMAILDRRVTIPRGTRKIFEHVNLLTESLQQQTSVHVSCCQATVAVFHGAAQSCRSEPGMKLLGAFFSNYSDLNPDVTGSFKANTVSRVTPVNTGVGRCDARPERRGVS